MLRRRRQRRPRTEAEARQRKQAKRFNKEAIEHAQRNDYQGALRLYQNLGFVRDKRLARYYLSGNDAYRMKLLFPLPPQRAEEQLAAAAAAAAVVSHPEEIDGDGARG